MRARALLPVAILLVGACAAAGTPVPTPALTDSAPAGTAETPAPSADLTSPTLATPVIAAVGPTLPPIVHGAPLAAGPKLDAAGCERLIRADREAAQRIRSAVILNGGSLASDAATVAEVADAPAASISPELGIPLTPAEERLVKTNGVSDWAPLYWWVNTARPERFGSYWIDRTGGGARYTVAIPPSDAATMALARCLEQPRVVIQYVQAAVSLAILIEIRDRIESDRDWLAAQGMGWRSLGMREDIGRVPVGVEKPTPEIEAFYRARYGWPVLIEQAPEVVSW